MFLEAQIITLLRTIIHLHPILQTTTQVTKHRLTTVAIKVAAAVRLLGNFRFFFLAVQAEYLLCVLCVALLYNITMFSIVQSLRSFILFKIWL